MASPQLVIQVAANLAAVQAQLQNTLQPLLATTSKQLSSMSTSFDGSKIISQASAAVAAVDKLGGVATLTESEQAKLNSTLNTAIDKYTALGKTAPAAMLELEAATKTAGTEGASFTSSLTRMFEVAAGVQIQQLGSELLGMAASSIEAGKELAVLSATTGIGVQQLQTLSYAASLSGGSLDGITSAIDMLETKLGKGDTGAIGAIRTLGLSVQQFLAESPGEQITDLADAFAAMTDPEQRAATASELFGRSWKTILPTLLETAQEGGDAIVTMSDGAVRGLKLLDDTWTTVTTNIKNETAEEIGELGTLIEWYRTFKAAADPTGTSVTQLTSSINASIPVITKGAEANATWGTNIGLAATNAHGFTAEAAAYLKAQDDAAKAAEAHAKAVSDLADVFTGKKLADQIELTSEALTKAGGAGNLSDEQLQSLDKTLVKYVQDGGALPANLEKIYIAQGLWTTGLIGTNKALMDLIATMPSFSLVPKQIAADVDQFSGIATQQKIQNLSDTLDYLRDHGMLTAQALKAIAAAAVELSDKGGTLNANLTQAAIDTQAWLTPLIGTNKELKALIDAMPSIELPKPPIDEWKQFEGVLGALEGAFNDLGRTGSAAMQQVGQDLSGFLSLLKQIDKINQMPAGADKTAAQAGVAAAGAIGSVGAIQTGNVAQGALSGAELGAGGYGLATSAGLIGTSVALGAATMGIGAAVIGGIALAKKLTASAGRDLVTQFAQSMGGFDALHQKLDELTAAGEADGEKLWVSLTQGVGKNNPQQAQAAIDAVNAALSKFSTDTDTANSNLETLMGNLQAAGIKVPAELDPMLSKLITSGDLKTATADIGKLTGALGDYNSALGDDSNFEKIAQDASDIGLQASDMNATFKQGVDDASADKIAAQWQELLPYVNNADVLAQKYLGSAQQMVTDALTAGTSIPSSMKPIIESLETQGLLVDQNGDKLTDLSKVNFKDDPLTTALDKLNETLDLIIKNLTDGMKGAFDSFSANGTSAAGVVGKALAGIAIPGDVDVIFKGSDSGSGSGDSGDNQPQMASGGYVPPRVGGTSVTLAEGGEGEFVIPASKMGAVGAIGAGTGITINVNVDAALLDAGAADRLAGQLKNAIIPHINTALAQRRIKVPSGAVSQRVPHG